MISGKSHFFDFMVTVRPIHISDEQYYVLTLTDISSEKRKIALERIFFHDVLNMAGSLNGFFNLLKETNDPAEYKELVELAREVSNHLTEEVQAQRQLLAAENGDLQIQLTQADSLVCIREAISAILLHTVSQNRSISIDKQSMSFVFQTDTTILRRILINLMKNALEAGEDSEVLIGCKMKDQRCSFYVHNPELMPNHVRLQVFQRSFSSKGINRGLGTYSIKLLTEEYLHGHVSFISEANTGTVFTVDLPA